MAADENNLASRSGRLFESQKGYDPRVVLFYFIISALLVVLISGLAYQQLFNAELHAERESSQNQRRSLIPGPRGNIYDRHGQLLVGNRPRFAVVLYLDELRAKFRAEFIRIRKNYRTIDDKDIPTSDQLWTLARVSIVQSYLEQINAIIGRDLKVDTVRLTTHFSRELLLPYPLVEDLAPAEYARLLEHLPVISPLQLYTTNTREYPFGSAASQSLGYVGINEDVAAEDFPGAKLRTFKMRGSVGRDGLESKFDSTLQGEAGGAIFRVDPLGYRIRAAKPTQTRLPIQGQNLITSLDIDLQLAAEAAIGEQTGAAVAIDIKTGEILALASKPDYDLSKFTPRLGHPHAPDIPPPGRHSRRIPPPAPGPNPPHVPRPPSPTRLRLGERRADRRSRRDRHQDRGDPRRRQQTRLRSEQMPATARSRRCPRHPRSGSLDLPCYRRCLPSGLHLQDSYLHRRAPPWITRS